MGRDTGAIEVFPLILRNVTEICEGAGDCLDGVADVGDDKEGLQSLSLLLDSILYAWAHPIIQQCHESKCPAGFP